jgi:biopolymer transport protein ExbD
MSSLIPEEELKQQKSLNLTPMVDFLFLILAVFAVMAVTRTMLYDSDVQMVKMETKTPPPAFGGTQSGSTILLSIDERGQYKWITEFNEFLLDGVSAVTSELHRQQEMGFLPKDKSKIKVLLQIDRNAQWHHVAKAIYSLKEAGFSISPVYSPEES